MIHSMPFNVPSGRQVQIALTFFSSGQITVPTSATVIVTYPPSSNSLVLVSCSLPMSATGSYFVTTWASSVAALGLSSATGVAPGIASADPQTFRITS